MLPMLIGLGISAYNAYKGHEQQKKADRLQQQALDQSTAQYNERAPFRQQALSMLSGIEGDSGLPASFGINQGNPYARGQSRVSTAMGAGGVPGQPTDPRRAQPRRPNFGPPPMPMMPEDGEQAELMPLGARYAASRRGGIR